MLVVLTVLTVESPVWPCVCAVVAVVGTLLHIDWVGVEVEVVSEISGQCWQPGRAEHSEQSPVKSGHNRHSQE